MVLLQGHIPPGPKEAYKANDGLLEWLGRQFSTYGDIFKCNLYGTDSYAIRDPEFAHHILVENWQNYVKGQIIERVALLLGNGLMASEGDVWKRQRRMIQPVFNHESIRGVVALITSLNSELLKRWQQAAQQNANVNVTRDVSSMALEVILRFIFGRDYEEFGARFDSLSREQVRNMAFARAFRALGKVILQVMDRRRKSAEAPRDALSMMMQACDPQTGQLMNDQQLVDEVLTLIVAGHETTASTLNWTWYLLSQHPQVEERLSLELRQLTNPPEFEDLPKFPYTGQVIEETMRLFPAGWLLSRRALGDDKLGEFFVPAGTEVYILPYFIQRNPAVWVEPDRFDPDRFAPENSKGRHRLATIPFSAGPRNCIGMLFARVEMQFHLMIIAKSLRMNYVPSRTIELDAGVNLRSKYDFIMFPKVKAVTKSSDTSS